MHFCFLRTQTKILPDHCCRYWNIVSNGRAKSLKHFLDTTKQKKPWAIFVDSTILVNGYHIYSAACNYNSSVSNLCFIFWDASQVFLWSPIFRQCSGPSLAQLLKACCPTLRKEIAPAAKQVTRTMLSCHIGPPKLLRTRIVGKGV